jgi:hypothetical protein
MPALLGCLSRRMVNDRPARREEAGRKRRRATLRDALFK